MRFLWLLPCLALLCLTFAFFARAERNVEYLRRVSIMDSDDPVSLENYADEQEIENNLKRYGELRKHYGMDTRLGTFDKLYESLSMLVVIRSTDINNKKGVTLLLRRVCQTLVYRLGSKIPMDVENKKQDANILSASLQEERSSYWDMLKDDNPFSSHIHFTEGLKAMVYEGNLEEFLKEYGAQKEGNPDYRAMVPVANYYYVAAYLRKDTKFPLQDKENPVYRKYRDIYCSPKDPRYEKVYNQVVKYHNFFGVDRLIRL